MLDIVNEVKNFFLSFCSCFCNNVFFCCVFPAFWNLDFNHLFCTSVDCIVVHLNDCITLTSVCCFCSSLHKVDSLFFRNDVSQFEECRLKYSVDTLSKSDLFTDLDTIDYVELDVVVSNVALNLSWQMMFNTFHIPWAVQKECTTVNQLLYHVVLTYIGWVVAGYEVCTVNQVCRFDCFLTETQVGHCNTTRFL